MSKFIFRSTDRHFSEHNEVDVSKHFTKIPENTIVPPQDIIFKGNPDCKCVEFKSDNKLYTSYFIGVDWIIEKEKAIYVEPKLNDESKQTDYLKMLFSALKHQEVKGHTEYSL